MRQSATYGGLIPDSPDGRSRLKFVTEGEASLHACLASGLGPSVLTSGDAFIIADMGGGTLDINTYEIVDTEPLQIEEIAASDCCFAGSIFVNRSARTLLQNKLHGSKYGTQNAITHIIEEEFDRTTKRLFADSSKVQFVKVGGAAERDGRLGIRGGKLRLEGSDVAECFEFSIQEAVASISRQKQAAGLESMDVWLVGGFAASPWLFSQLKAQLAPIGISIYRPDANTSKAVADGAISFYLDHWVTARVAKLSCGFTTYQHFNPSNPDHVQRRHRTWTLPSGQLAIGDCFECCVAKGMKVTETTVINVPFLREVTSLDAASSFQFTITCYTGSLPMPTWKDECPDDFQTLGLLKANLSRLCRPSNSLVNGVTRYWRLYFDVEIKFGLTEYEARVKWKEDGVGYYGPASFVYEELQFDVQ